MPLVYYRLYFTELGATFREAVRDGEPLERQHPGSYYNTFTDGECCRQDDDFRDGVQIALLNSDDRVGQVNLSHLVNS